MITPDLRREIDQFFTQIYPSGLNLNGRGPRFEYEQDADAGWAKCPRAPGHIMPDNIKSIQLDDSGKSYNIHHDKPSGTGMRFSDDMRSDIDARQAFPALNGWYTGDAAYKKAAAFARVMNDANKAHEILSQMDPGGLNQEEQALRRDVCHAVMSQWQALTYSPDRPVVGMAFENLQMDLPDRQMALMRYVALGAEAYNLCWTREKENILGMPSSVPDGKLDYCCGCFEDAGASMIYDFIQDFDCGYYGELSEDMTKAVNDFNRLVGDQFNQRDFDGACVRYGDFGMLCVPKYGCDMSDKILNSDSPELCGLSNYQQLISDEVSRMRAQDGCDLNIADASGKSAGSRHVGRDMSDINAECDGLDSGSENPDYDDSLDI